MTYRKVKIYFASGTGNSYRIAEWFSDECVKRNIDSKIIPINKAKPKEEIEASSTNLIVLAYPTYLVMPPWSVIKFIFKMPVKKGTHFFCMPTRGCFPISRTRIFPGGAGLATILPLIILPLKGYNVRGALSFDMPFNHLYLVPSFSEKGISLILGKAKKKAERTFDKLFSGKLLWLSWDNLWDLFWSILPLILFPTLLVVYLLFGRLFQAKVLFANTRCTGCGVCAKSCPTKAIKMKGKKQPRPFWGYKCDNCLRCIAYCKFNAIEAGHSWAVILIIISIIIGNIPVSLYLFSLIDRFSPNACLLKNIYIVKFIKFVCYYLAILLAYNIFHYLIRFSIFNKIFTYTALTHYYRRYQEPETVLDDLTGKKNEIIESLRYEKD